MNIAIRMSEISKCSAKKVSCIIVKNNSIISSGINGTPSGYANCNDIFIKKEGLWYTSQSYFICRKDYYIESQGKKFYLCEDMEIHHKWSLKYEIHAEINAISKVARNSGNTEGASNVYYSFTML
ncbi:hypothetical protein FPHOBKDP_00007 [Listeria phage LPJP1]|nr:hypothetical protein FPHOBKDP_00007 [Listeria phage LPJP1]